MAHSTNDAASPSRIRVLLGADGSHGEDRLRQALENEPDMTIVAQAPDGDAAQELAAELSPHVAVLPITLARTNGIKATRRILAACPQTKVIAVCEFTHGALASEMLHAGAAGCLCKKVAADEIAEAVRAVVAGRTYVSSRTGGPVGNSAPAAP